MLVLTRRLDESILIGDDIEIKIVQIKGSGEHAQVRLGIYEEVREENRRAAGSQPDRLKPEELRGLLSPRGGEDGS